MEQQNQEKTAEVATAATADGNEPPITEANAVITIEGQEFEIETSLARDDRLLKTVLQPHFSAVENAEITREVKNGKLFVRLVKRAQHKG